MDQLFTLYGDGNTDASEIIKKVSQKNVVFGHQSVGSNILSGIGSLENASNVKLNRLETREINDEAPPFFIDYRVGRNQDAQAKVDDFSLVTRSIDDSLRVISFFKFCYVDIQLNTQVEELFSYYKSTMYSLKEECPEQQIVLVTVPLTLNQRGLKAFVKKILGRVPSGVIENTRRHAFNELLRNEMAEDFPVFDLAAIESSQPDGTKCVYNYKGESYPVMSPLYTDDGGHLNQFGSKTAAYNLLAFLAELK